MRDLWAASEAEMTAAAEAYHQVEVAMARRGVVHPPCVVHGACRFRTEIEIEEAATSRRAPTIDSLSAAKLIEELRTQVARHERAGAECGLAAAAQRLNLAAVQQTAVEEAILAQSPATLEELNLQLRIAADRLDDDDLVRPLLRDIIADAERIQREAIPA